MNDTSTELAEVRARLAVLEAERDASRRRLRGLGGFVALGLLVATGASAADGLCPNGLPFCFSADTPALASQVNHNFDQLKEWLEAKVGTAGAAVRIGSGAVIAPGAVIASTSVTPPTQATRALFVSGTTVAGSDPLIDVRHDNLSQGIGIGWNSVVATGSSPNQDIQLVAKGTGQVISTSPLNVGASVTSCASGPCYCPAGSFPLTWTGTCSNAGVGVYSVAAVTNVGGQKGFDVQCISSNFASFASARNMTVICSRLVTP